MNESDAKQRGVLAKRVTLLGPTRYQIFMDTYVEDNYMTPTNGSVNCLLSLVTIQMKCRAGLSSLLFGHHSPYHLELLGQNNNLLIKTSFIYYYYL